MNAELRSPVGGPDTRFRFDINALRALAVISVLGYHLQFPGFAGGFVGVDVFFVITGYLMTSKVVNDLIAGRYSYPQFMTMRLRRIYPALVVVVIATVVAGWFLTLPGEYFRHLRHACSALLFLSNFAFDADHGYFATAAQTKPLLHTWSLAVEWQFYIWLPLVLSLIWHRSPRSSFLRTTITVLSIGSVTSLAWCLWQSHHDAMGSSFFSLRARAWEPLVGGIIAMLEIARRHRPTPLLWSAGTSIGIGGWLLLGICIVTPLPESRWPGALTVLPIAGAALVIAANGQWRVVRTAAVQRVGDWSYSIYLWHWPIEYSALQSSNEKS
ncbi:acyltransferase [Bradyrhizobium sp. NC92]|uniref:acyltransferase family protein n=1 Tax=Bradyrhizobium sp. (strain NC92) TaxID=55395 RepID=UPI0021AABF33|nr:acyltransferase [Bradyrhizobium sp. NC92]UWU66230.1 acyltransferase [Bradyrhizobium sp. NC92]